MFRNIHYEFSYHWYYRYKQTICEHYEWIYPANGAFKYIKNYLPYNTSIKILELGCGTSTLCEKLFAVGYYNITCLDISKYLIKTRTKKNKTTIKYIHHDMTTQLPFYNHQFDLIIEKNSIDCLFCHDSFPRQVLGCINECFRVLKVNGMVLSFTHGMKKHRKMFYRNKMTPFELDIIKLSNDGQKSADCWLYVCKKSEEADKRSYNNGLQSYYGEYVDQNIEKEPLEKEYLQGQIAYYPYDNASYDNAYYKYPEYYEQEDSNESESLQYNNQPYYDAYYKEEEYSLYEDQY